MAAAAAAASESSLAHSSPAVAPARPACPLSLLSRRNRDIMAILDIIQVGRGRGGGGATNGNGRPIEVA